MAAFKRTLTIDQGASYDKRFTWKTGPKGSETPVNLTGCTARMVVRANATSDTDLLVLTTENGGITLGGVTGTIDIYITDVQTAAFANKANVYQLEITLSTGRVRRFLEGQFVVNPELG